MGTTSISSLSTSDITALQDDVNELNTKLNALIVEFNKCSDDTTTNKGKIDTLITDIKTGTNNHTSKIDTLITDMTAMQTRVSGSYSPGNSGESTSTHGNASDPILLRLERLDEDYVNIENYVRGKHTGRSTGRGSGATITALNSLTAVSTASTGAASGTSSGTGDNTSINTTSSSVTGSYGSAATKVITIGAKGEVRGKRLARQTLNRLRK